MTVTCKKYKKPKKVKIYRNVININQNNPAKIAIKLNKPQKVKVVIYTQRGRLVKKLIDQVADAGTFDAAWNGVNRRGRVVPAGVYIVYIQTEEFQAKRRIVVIR